MSNHRLIPNTFQTFNAHVDIAMHLLTGNEYKVLNFATRHVLGWQSNLHDRTGEISMSTFVDGFTTKDGEKYYGCGLSEAAIRDILKELTAYELLVKVGEPTQRGQSWRIGETPDWQGLTKRAEIRAEKDRQRIEKARASRKGGVVGQDLLLNKTTDTLLDKTTPVLSDYVHTNPSLNPSLNPYPPANADSSNEVSAENLDEWFSPVEWETIGTRQSRMVKAVYQVWGYHPSTALNALMEQMLRGVCTAKSHQPGNIPAKYKRRFEPEELGDWHDWYMQSGIQSDDKALKEKPLKVQESIIAWIEAGKPKGKVQVKPANNRPIVTAASTDTPVEDRAAIADLLAAGRRALETDGVS